VCTTPTSGRSRSRTLDPAISHQLRDASLSTSCHLYNGAPREPKETGHQRRIVESSSPCMACVAYLFCGISCPRLTPVVHCDYFNLNSVMSTGLLMIVFCLSFSSTLCLRRNGQLAALPVRQTQPNVCAIAYSRLRIPFWCMIGFGHIFALSFNELFEASLLPVLDNSYSH